MNRSAVIPEKEENISIIDAIVDKQMDRLKDVKGTIYGKQQLLAQHVIHKWKNRKNPGQIPPIAGVVIQAFPRLRNKPKPNGVKINKVEPEPSTSSDSSSGPHPNGNLQNQEPFIGTDNNV